MMMKDILSNRKIKMTTLVITDFVLILLSYFLGFIFRFYLSDSTLIQIIASFGSHLGKVILSAIIYILIFYIFKQYKSIWTLAGINEIVNGVIAVTLGGVVSVLISLISKERIPLMVTLLAGIMILILCNGVRVAWRILRRAIMYNEASNPEDLKRVLIIGAGSGGALVSNEYKKFPQLKRKVVAFIDDDRQKLGTYVNGVKVYGNREDIIRVAKEKKVDEIIIAIASIKDQVLKELIEKCTEAKIAVKIMPGVAEMIDGKFSINKIRDIDVEDLLGRETIKLDHDGIADYLEGKTVLVTGGGGSIGSELCRQISKFKPKQLIIFDIYENNAYDIQNELKRTYPDLNLVTLIGSVRDRQRLRQIYTRYNPNVVFHAAAHKHVPLMEISPEEAIKNNVVGTFNTAEFANSYGVEKFVLISTDKAVNPTNIMGATKRMCEMIVQAFNKVSDTEFVAVRFGNVLGSNGSVIPLFKKQIAAGGPVTLTHKEITRYFMTIPEASQLVLQAGAYAEGGEIFVLDMGKPVKIYDLAENLIKLSGYEPHRDIKIEVTGLRPGEKLYEELLMNEEGLTETKHEKIFIGKPGDFEIDDIAQKTEELLKYATKGSKIRLKKQLKMVVDTFKEPEEINSKVI
ncbi:nucleoside-diphosphate sugar epimerase/dehydratase [Clostridium celatum]|uniref:polysaccharide biosynthesis protein n=1 Tax=Clostridium celatum TaxID=36834 RepID=UPI002901CEF6|nr:nucleoside-diphosphate sugar epimerase/dehydratase [Clostridium celatum]MDU2265570.1 nucleoside-diphosphate sugar epimerase/dehydratase [Clostridium celatum]MDU6295426.1 nucleoside-diphosphate sugar epimerase/dehydratase [Clostridium celatum]